MRLTWSDLLIEGISPADFQRWLLPWSSVVRGRVAPAFMSKFGTWFLRRPEGHVEMLDVFTGKVSRVANTYEGFVAEVNDRSWQEVYLLSELVFRLHQEGKVAGPGECYALAPHPALGGPNPLAGEAVDTRFVLVMDIGVWQHLCAQSIFGPNASPAEPHAPSDPAGM
ncbi:MAG: hypothetical protein J2P46_17740 [Zavarzinella sp.]|nr:hypothetical protein [Zavarzinella sp.]